MDKTILGELVLAQYHFEAAARQGRLELHENASYLMATKHLRDAAHELWNRNTGFDCIDTESVNLR